MQGVRPCSVSALGRKRCWGHLLGEVPPSKVGDIGYTRTKHGGIYGSFRQNSLRVDDPGSVSKGIPRHRMMHVPSFSMAFCDVLALRARDQVIGLCSEACFS